MIRPPRIRFLVIYSGMRLKMTDKCFRFLIVYSTVYRLVRMAFLHSPAFFRIGQYQQGFVVCVSTCHGCCCELHCSLYRTVISKHTSINTLMHRNFKWCCITERVIKGSMQTNAVVINFERNRCSHVYK